MKLDTDLLKGRHRGWCFTVNNPTPEDMAYVLDLYESDLNTTYLIAGHEIAPRTGTIHLQCYIYYRNAISWKTAQNKFEPWHFESQNACLNVLAYCYCMDSTLYIELGERPRQGHRTDLEVIRHDIESGVPMMKIAREYFSQWCQYRRSFDEFKKMFREFDTKMIMYDLDNIKGIYTGYNLDEAYVVKRYELLPDVVEHMFYSGKYMYIFIPNDPSFENLRILCDHTI